VSSVSRRALLATVGVSAVAGGSSCAAIRNFAGKSLSNPAVRDFITQVAATLGAEIVMTVGEKFEGVLADWSDGILSKWNEWSNEGEIADCRYGKVRIDNSATPTIVVVGFFSYVDASTEACKASSIKADPMNDYCAVFFDTANDAILLPAWAWQTLLMFADEQCSDKEGADLERIKQFLKISLSPISSHTEEHETWANAVATVSWQTSYGPVDIGRIEKDDHGYEGIIKVSGFPDGSKKPTVFKGDLPTEPA
jgi:lipoprotein